MNDNFDDVRWLTDEQIERLLDFVKLGMSHSRLERFEELLKMMEGENASQRV